jgi:hypothetical protein
MFKQTVREVNRMDKGKEKFTRVYYREERTITKVGNSWMVALPPWILEHLNWVPPFKVQLGAFGDHDTNVSFITIEKVGDRLGRSFSLKVKPDFDQREVADDKTE